MVLDTVRLASDLFMKFAEENLLTSFSPPRLVVHEYSGTYSRLLVSDPVFWKDGKEPDGQLQIGLAILQPGSAAYQQAHAKQFCIKRSHD